MEPYHQGGNTPMGGNWVFGLGCCLSPSSRPSGLLGVRRS